MVLLRNDVTAGRARERVGRGGASHGLKTSRALWAALETARQFDATVALDPRRFPQMLRRHVPPVPYSREIVFERMLAGEPVVVTGFPAPLRGPVRGIPPDQAAYALVDWLAKRRIREKHRVYTGPTGVRRELTLRQIASKWKSDRTSFGVTDLHLRGTAMEEVIDPEILSSFNLLPRASDGAQQQEMFSFVISTRGHVTDSHSDDPDSSNYCFAGRKLWLAWDTYEGAKAGLQDVERVGVMQQAHFDMRTWLALRSARWCLVNAGETLFLPGHLTHKVITLERYIGVGGFIVALPNCLRLLAHWMIRGPLWAKRDSTGESDELLGEIAEAVQGTILRLRRAPLRERQRWGYDFLERSAEAFLKTCPPGQQRLLRSDPRFRQVADVIRAPWPPLPIGYGPPPGPKDGRSARIHSTRKPTRVRSVELPL